MNRLHRQSGWLPLLAALALLGQLPVVACADPLLGGIRGGDSSEGRSPGSIDAGEEAGLAREDELEDEFLWAGDLDFGLLMSFDPDDEEIFLGWQVEF